MRDHTPVPIESFNGLWVRGTEDACPQDHFTDCSNIDFTVSSVFSRGKFAKYLDVLNFTPGRTVVYNNINTKKTYLLSLDPIMGNLYSIQIFPVINVPILILAVPGMRDFGFVNMYGRAYISPSNGLTGISGQLVRVYDGTTLRNALGIAPSSTMTASVPVLTGDTDPGFHWLGVAFEFDSGYITPFRPLQAGPLNFIINRFISLANIPLGPVGCVARIFVSTKAMVNTTNQFAFAQRYYFISGVFGRLGDNTTTSTNITFFDSQLVESADYLATVTQKLDAGSMLASYKGRLACGGMVLDSSLVDTNQSDAAGGIDLIAPQPQDPSVVKISNAGDPETINTVNGILIIDPANANSVVDTTGNTQKCGITDAQEYRDAFYIAKLNKFYGTSDNGGNPSSWTIVTIDEGIGSFPWGITPVLDSGGVNVDSFLVADKTGMYLFNGTFRKPEASYKIANLWQKIAKGYDPNNPLNSLMHFVNDSVNKKIYVSCQFGDNTRPTTILVCDYQNTDTADEDFWQKARWTKWNFDVTNFTPNAVFVIDDGTKVNLLVMDGVTQRSWLYNGTSLVKEILQQPMIQTALISDKEGNFLHFGPIRVNGSGGSSLQSFLSNYKSTRVQQFGNLVLPANPISEPVLLTNFLSQKAKLKLIAPNDSFFEISRLTFYVKPTFTSAPQ